MLKKLLTFLAFTVIFMCGVECNTYLEIGEICLLDKSGKTGTCKYLYDCPQAQEQLQSHKIKPKICGYQHITPIICCEKSNKTETAVTTAPPTINPEYLSASKKKCLEYANLVYKNQSAPTLLPGILWEIANTCAYDEKAGPAVNEKEFPHMVAIGYKTKNSDDVKYKCTGALISEEYILTTATCTNLTYYGLPKVVRLGTTIVKENYFEYPQVQYIEVQEFIRYPGFKNYTTHDIALIKLASKPILNSFTRPACVTKQNQPKQVIAVGYSSIYNDGNFNNIMNKTTLNMKNQCDSGNNIICTDVSSVLDQGAPLVTYNQSPYCTYNVIGLLSYVGNRRTGFITDVAKYVDWIENNVWENES